MNKLILFLLFSFCFNVSAQNQQDLSSYLCKYSFEWQKDSTNIFSKAKDVMYLEIGKEKSVYYSYLRFLGLKNFNDDIAAQKSLNYIRSNTSRYYANSESEVIEHYFQKKEVKVLDKLSGNGITYCYTENVDNPQWKLEPDTLQILNQLCQKATTSFKGRDYIAWFAPSIPISVGPWQFTGLPGLILRIHDTKYQFVFECTEIGSAGSDDLGNMLYTNCYSVPKSKLRELKRLKEQDIVSFQKMQNPGLTYTMRNRAGEILPIPPPKPKPSNPIDLSN